jgi:hypothetical protein
LHSLEDDLIGNLNTLTLGFDSWLEKKINIFKLINDYAKRVLGSSYVEDSILKSIWLKLKASLSSKMKNFSFFILT